MQTLKLTFLAILATSLFSGCNKDHSPVEPENIESPEHVKTIVRPDFEAIKKNSRTPSGALDKIETVVEGNQYANHMPGTRQYLYDNAGRNIGFADILSPKDSSPGACDVIYEYKDDRIYRMYHTVRGEGYWGELEPNLIMREFAYDISGKVTRVYVYYVDFNNVATLDEGNTFTLKYDGGGHLTEMSTSGNILQKQVFKYSGNNLESATYYYSDVTSKTSSEYTSQFEYDDKENGLKNLPEIPKLFHPGPSYFDQIFGDNNLVSLKISSTFYPTTTSGSETKIQYANKFDDSGRLVEKIEDFKDGTPLVKKIYIYK
ncbi:hypothetical protein GCM10007423_23720 [Dyadobacter endophyticus]|uniref:YD repeat-containing protein n=1 Tax=Dyadobacter endophyticus TaxID=1749036 RepID=A0ABQ1YRB8_9BACT|nr:hypothetical protein [Dyadobacter endophyticus]GGH33443.1 hypothetical protein GCM10007423_23720 [Dyadobacter endophyticus]